MAHKPHTVDKISFQANGPKWTFTHVPTGFQYITRLKGGFETAEKVANIINGSFKRNQAAHGLDGLARTNLFQLFQRQKDIKLDRFSSHLFNHVRR